MSLLIREVKMADLDAIVKIESAAFDMTEEFTRKDMQPRIINYSDTFLVAEVDNQVVGHIFGPAFNKRYIEDEIYFNNHPNNKSDKYQTILSLAVDPAFRKQGIGSQLVEQMIEKARNDQRQAVTLTCLPKLFNFYERLGFVNEGKTNDDIPDPDNETSYNMVKLL